MVSGPPRLIVAPAIAIACLQVFAGLLWVLAILLALLGVRGAFDDTVALAPSGAVVGAGAAAALAILMRGLARRIRALVNRS